MTYSVLAVGSPTQNLSILDPASPSAEAIRGLFLLVGAILTGIFLLVEGVLIVSLIQSRRRKQAVEIEPPQVYGSKPIEIAWTAAPTMVVFVLILLVARTIWEVRVDPYNPPPGSEPLYITVIGHQWWWEYRYTSYKGKELSVITANELHMPVSDATTPRPVYLDLQSADVCHSFWIPRLGGKTDLIPARANTMWLQTNEVGVHLGQCAEYCGTQHANMLLRVYAEPPADFEKWLAAEAKPAVEDVAVKVDRAVFFSESCVSCHTIRGTTAKGIFGPDLTHLMSRETLASGMIKNTPENLERWINDPQTVKPGCLMPAFKLDEKPLKSVVRYLGTLK